MDLDRYKGMPEWARNVDPHVHAYPSYMPRAVEREQLDEAVEVNDATAEYLYTQFTPTTTHYPTGTRPLLEEVVNHVCADCRTDLDRALALVLWRRANYRHVGKCGLGTEEEILLSGYSMCHDAARCLIALCQVAGLGARMVLGLNDATQNGHTFMEVYAGGRWMILDPSPGIPYAYYQLPDGTYANARDIQLDPTIPARCPRHLESNRTPETIASYFTNCRLANYSLEESTRHMARRFLRMAAAMKVLENYDYIGHMNHPPIAAHTDLDALVSRWLADTVPAPSPSEAEVAPAGG